MTFGPETRIGFVCVGRLGASLAVAMAEAGYRVVAIARRSAADAERVAARIQGAAATENAQVVVDASDVVFVTAVDRLIGPVASGLRYRPGQAVLHCSGATPVSALQAAREHGAIVGGFHPMQTFPDEHGEDRFVGVTFGVETDVDGLRSWLIELAEKLGGGAILLDASDRAVYHASGAMVSPLVVGLVGLAADLWTTLGRSREEGLTALTPLLVSTAEQIREKGIPDAITGPYARGDVETVVRHVEALRSASPEVLHAYAALALAQLPIAAEQGKISDHSRERIKEILRWSNEISKGPAAP